MNKRSSGWSGTARNMNVTLTSQKAECSLQWLLTAIPLQWEPKRIRTNISDARTHQKIAYETCIWAIRTHHITFPTLFKYDCKDSIHFPVSCFGWRNPTAMERTMSCWAPNESWHMQSLHLVLFCPEFPCWFLRKVASSSMGRPARIQDTAEAWTQTLLFEQREGWTLYGF